MQVIRSARRRRTISLAVSGGRVVVRAPLRTPIREIESLLQLKRAWIEARLAREAGAPGPRAFGPGERIPYLGRELVVCSCAAETSRATVELRGGELHVHAPAHRRRDAAIGWYRARAAEAFAASVARWSPELGVTPKAVLVRDQKHRWGSCGPDGTIRLNYRLVLGEPDVVDYVVVHELAHLRHRNHGPAFWAEVSRVLPNYLALRKRLQEQGPVLVV